MDNLQSVDDFLKALVVRVGDCEEMAAFGTVLRETRESNHKPGKSRWITQKILSKETGYAEKQAEKWEKNMRVPDKDTFREICKVLYRELSLTGDGYIKDEHNVALVKLSRAWLCAVIELAMRKNA